MSEPTRPRGSIQLDDLRSRVESRLATGDANANANADERKANDDLDRLVYELRVYQAELEMQNEELRASELELTAHRDHLQRLYDHAPVGYATLDAVGRVVDNNVTLCQRLGCGRAWLLGRTLSSLMSESDANTFHLHLHQVLGGALHHTCEVALRHTSGAIVQARLESSPIMGIPSQAGQVLTAVVDLTDLRYAEEEARTSEAHAKTVLDTTTDAILTLNAEHRIETFNAAALRMFGHDQAALRGRAASTLLAQPTPPCVERFLASGSCSRAGTDDPLVVMGRRHDGTEIPLELGIGSWHDHGTPKLTVLLRDITEQRKAAQRLRESEARLREIATNVTDVLYVRGQGGQLVYVSPAYEEIWGLPTRVALASAPEWLESVDPRDRSLVDEAHARVLEGEAVAVEYRISRPDGSTRWIRDNATPVFDAEGAAIRYVGVARDITEDRHIEDDVRQASKMEAVNTLAAGIAHDFRNLLHGIGGCVVVAERHLADPEQLRTFLGQIRDATRRGAALTDQLTAFSRRQDGDHPQPLVLDALIEETTPLLMRLMGEQIRVVLQLNAARAMVLADTVQIERILMNLAANACDAMPNGGTLVIRTETMDVDERATRPYGAGVAGPCVRLEVRDTGMGMDDATRERIFEPFFTTKAFGKGTGLGLAAVFGITHKLGGHVAVDSIPDIGAVFTFWLPRTYEAHHHEPTGPREIPVLSVSVLLVEDDALVRMSIRSDLESLGMHVIEARDPRHALSLAETLKPPPALLISDVMMPDMTGPRLAAELCTRFPELRVLLVSAHSAEDLIERGTVAAEAELLRKPFDKATLGRRVMDVLSPRENENENENENESTARARIRSPVPIRHRQRTPISSTYPSARRGTTGASPSAGPPPRPTPTPTPTPTLRQRSGPSPRRVSEPREREITGRNSSASPVPVPRDRGSTGPRPAAPPPPPPARPTPHHRLRRGPIFLVDDDENGRMALAALLEDEGMRVIAAADPAQALRQAEVCSETILLLIADVNLPQMRGDALVRQFLERRREPIDVLYLSGAPLPDDIDPVGECILKPVDFDELLERIREILGRRTADPESALVIP